MSSRSQTARCGCPGEECCAATSSLLSMLPACRLGGALSMRHSLRRATPPCCQKQEREFQSPARIWSIMRSLIQGNDFILRYGTSSGKNAAVGPKALYASEGPGHLLYAGLPECLGSASSTNTGPFRSARRGHCSSLPVTIAQALLNPVPGPPQAFSSPVGCGDQRVKHHGVTGVDAQHRCGGGIVIARHGLGEAGSGNFCGAPVLRCGWARDKGTQGSENRMVWQCLQG